jgi:twitching motility protein PilT
MEAKLEIGELLTFMKQQNASDLHLTAGLAPMIRVHGSLKRIKMDPLGADEVRRMLYAVLTEEQRKRYENDLELDFPYQLRGVARFRVNAFRHERGDGAAFRIIPSEIPTLASLNMPTVLTEMALKEKGLILVTGPTGSGKSTTLAAMVNYINENKYGHIITVEDPIEFMHTSKNCLVHQRELGGHTHSFAKALRSALREDPDVILVGELRDLETTALAITAAETGHLVMGTLHTNSASKTIDRTIDIFPADSRDQVRTMLSESIVSIVAQALVPRKDGKGRVAALEILVASTAIRNLIREGKNFQIPSIIQTSQHAGMQSMDFHLRDLVLKDLITREEALKKATDPRLFGEGAEKPPLRK